MRQEMMEKDRQAILDDVQRLLYTYGLNRVIRYAQRREEVHQTQSVAEHVTNILFCAYHFRDIEDSARKVDFDELTKLILMHDMGEIETGDVITTRKTENDIESEITGIKEVKKKSPTFVANEIESNFHRFENPETPEERFAKAMDKFEGLLFWFTDDGIKMIKTINESPTIERYFEKLEATIEELDFPRVLEYVVVMKEDMIRRGLLS